MATVGQRLGQDRAAGRQQDVAGSGSVAAVSLKNVYVKFKAVQARREQIVVALNDVSLDVKRGECLAIVGGSGSGKSTLARVVCGLLPPDSGVVEVDGERLYGKASKRATGTANVQMVFQDPYSSLDPLWSIRKSIEEAFLLRFGQTSDEEGRDAAHYLRVVGLGSALGISKPKQLSGGQVQRAAIARALAARPSVLIMDEAVSSLDVSVQAQVLQLIERIKQTEHLTILFIVHNLAVAAAISDRVAVFHTGRLVELGPSSQVFKSPKDSYTKDLISAIPRIASDSTAEARA